MAENPASDGGTAPDFDERLDELFEELVAKLGSDGPQAAARPVEPSGGPAGIERLLLVELLSEALAEALAPRLAAELAPRLLQLLEHRDTASPPGGPAREGRSEGLRPKNRTSRAGTSGRH